MPPHIVVIKGNITDVVADAVVNAANTKLLAGPGVSGAIFDAAGHDNLREVCHSLQPVHTGHAVITPGYASRAKYIIHAVAPRYLYNEASEEMITKQMKDVYKNSLRIAEANRCKSIAFPILGTGTRRYPRRRACREAIEAIHESEHEVNTVLVVAYGTSCFEIFHRELKIFQQGIDHLVQ